MRRLREFSPNAALVTGMVFSIVLASAILLLYAKNNGTLLPQNQTRDEDALSTLIGTDATRQFGEFVQATSLGDQLKTESFFVIFAPSNSAFSDANIASMGIAEPDLALDIAASHVIKLPEATSSISNDAILTSLTNEKITIVRTGSGLYANGVAIASEPIVAKNALIYTLEGTMSSTFGDLLSVSRTTAEISKFADAFAAHGMIGLLANPSADLTIFAPIDSAIGPDSKAFTAATLRNYIVQGMYYSPKFDYTGALENLNGGILKIENRGEDIYVVNGEVEAKIVRTDIPTSNGVIHLIDRTL